MKTMDVFEKRLMPLAEMIGKNKYLLTMRDSFAMVMPILIIGSMFTLLRNFPIPAWIDFLKTTMVQPDKSLFALLAIPSACTVSLMAIFLAFNIGYNFAEHIGIKDRASAGIVSLVSWFILMPQVTEFSPEEGVEPFLVDSIPLAWTGAKGVFIAMIVGFFAVGVFGYIIKKDWTIKMPEGVPPTVARAFSALIPMTVAFTAVWLVGIAFIISPWGNAFNFIYAILQAPLTSLGGTVWALAFSYVLASGFWFIGIHGSSVTGSIYTPILTALSLENQAAFAAGAALPNIVNREFETFFATFGGGGSTLSLLIAMLLFCNSKRIKDLAKISVAPGIFGINEPIIFGLPIVLNPVMLIPFILTPVVNIIIAYFIMDLGLVPLCNGVMLPWTTPPLVSGFLLSGWQGAVLQLFLIILGIFIYLPFIKTLDKEYLKEEAAASEESSTELEDFDSIDLDSVVL